MRRSTMFKHLLLLGCLSLFVVLGVYAQEMKHEVKQSGKITVVVTHEVKDYATWRKGYDADQPVRKKAGFKVFGVYTDTKNPNIVTIIGEFPSATAAEAFFTSADLKETMSKAGVVGAPDVKMLTSRSK
jgi:quinol monooxygenase YgiN